MRNNKCVKDLHLYISSFIRLPSHLHQHRRVSMLDQYFSQLMHVMSKIALTDATMVMTR